MIMPACTKRFSPARVAYMCGSLEYKSLALDEDC